MASARAAMQAPAHAAWDVYEPVRYPGAPRAADFILCVPGSHLRLEMTRAELVQLRTLLATLSEPAAA